MTVEEVISQIVSQYGSYLVSGSAIIIITIFVMNSLKDFAVNLVNYLSVKMSNLGYNTFIYWDHQLYRVMEINFTKIKIGDENRILFIPISVWLKAVKEYPIPGVEQFKESTWDGANRREHGERRSSKPRQE
jgi:hypothetical protein